MRKLTNSDILRKRVLDNYNSIINTVLKIMPQLEKMGYKTSFEKNVNASFYRLLNGTMFIGQDPNDIKWRTFFTLLSFKEATILSDYYITTNRDTMTKSEEDVKSLEYSILDSIRKNSFKNFNISTNYKILCDSSKRLLNASFYEKIVYFKSLGEEDIEFLSSINPFFQEELTLYGIDISPEFIINEIDKQFESNLPNEAIYQELAKLLADLFRIDDDFINDIISDLIETLNIDGEDIGMLIDVLDTDNEYDINQVLASLIQQYYKIKKDKNIYKK